MIIADTSGLLAYYNPRDREHRAVSEFIDGCDDTLVVSPYVVAELDYLMTRRGGVALELMVLEEMTAGAYDLPHMSLELMRSAVAVVRRYQDQDVNISDASLVVLARENRTRKILTLDHRHFTVLKPLDGGDFELLP